MPIEAARISALEVEASVSTINPELPASPRLLRAQIHTSLIHASDEGLLRSAPHEVFQLLNVSTTPDRMFASLTCGESFDKGQEDGNFLYRADGARLSFSMTVRFPDGDFPQLDAYRFHVRFPADSVPQFIRIDLNRPGLTVDPILEPRSHVHPGTDALRLPAPIMSPLQLVHAFLYDLSL